MEKNVTQSQTRSTNIYPPDHMAPGPLDKSGAAGAANGNNFAELVYKHLREQITQALYEAQQALALHQTGSTQHARQQKR